MRTRSYPSDLTDAQWARVRPHLPPPKPGGRRRSADLRAVVDALLYVLRTGCQWRFLPSEFPPKSTVWRYFDAWRRDGTIGKIHDSLREKVRKRARPRGPRRTASIDSQSVTASEGGEARGRDQHKNANGRKRHIVVDSLGLLLAVMATAADLDDGAAAPGVLSRLGERLGKLRRVFADNEYQNRALQAWLQAQAARYRLEVVRRPAGVVGWVVLPKRWVVERTFAWLKRCRRLSLDREKTVLSAEAMTRLAMIHLMLNRLDPKAGDAPFKYRAAA